MWFFVVRRFMGSVKICIFGLGTLFVSTNSIAGSLYLPLQLAPEIESRVERLFVVANMPIIKRPIPIKRIHEAVEKAKKTDPVLASSVEQYLERYSYKANITHFSATGSIADGADLTTPNARGASTQSDYQFSIAGHYIVNDHVAVNVGGIAFDGTIQERDTFAEGSFISLGWDVFQADIGFRPRWWGPFQDSDMLQSTNAAALPSITFSNIKPLTFLNISYEVFLGQMSESDEILSDDFSQFLTGNPLLFGTHLSINPFPGFALGFNRLLQFGGADRDQSPSGLFNAFFNVGSADNIGVDGEDFGNQLSSITARYTFTGKFPISVYAHYSGEDRSLPSDILLGNSALGFGIQFPKLTEQLDFTFEANEWQNGWYVNSNFGDGLTNFGTIVGHFGASFRLPDTDLGASAQSVKLIWDPYNGHSVTLRYRRVNNNTEGETEFETVNFTTIEYALATGKWITGLSLSAGNDLFGEDFQQLSFFVRW